MDVGILGIFQNYQGKFSDSQVMESEKRIAEQVEDMGFDKYWASEHHFTDYAFCADNLLWLSWLAGRTSTLKLCTGAVIIPWNNPLRVVEKFSMLDHISNGRAVLGLGRGLSRHEYECFGLDMNNARGMFDEGAEMVLNALRTGSIKSDGPFFEQKETEIRPHLPKDATERFYCVGMSPDSVDKCAELGATLPYDSLAQLRTALIEAVPHLARIDEVIENDVRALDAGPLGKATFRNAVKDFYLTNPIARASQLMAELSAQAQARKTEKIAAE